MSEDRPHRKALSRPQIVEELQNGAGTQFDPNLVESVLELLDADVMNTLPRRILRVISDDPTLYPQLWFASYPYGWEMEVWPPIWAETCPLDLLRPPNLADTPADMTMIDGRCLHTLPTTYSSDQESTLVWLDPVGEHEPALSRPLRLPQLLSFLDAGFFSPGHFPTEAASIRVLLADPYQLFRQALKSCLNEHPDFDIVLEASSPKEYKALRDRSDYDVAVVASDLLAGTHSTIPLTYDELHLDEREINGDVGSRPVVVLVTDEDIDGSTLMSAEDVRQSAGHLNPIYLHRSVSVEILADTLKFLHKRSRSSSADGRQTLPPTQQGLS